MPRPRGTARAPRPAAAPPSAAAPATSASAAPTDIPPRPGFDRQDDPLGKEIAYHRDRFVLSPFKRALFTPDGKRLFASADGPLAAG